MNRRFVVPNLSGHPRGIYPGFYVQRGHVPERPIGERKNGLAADGCRRIASSPTICGWGCTCGPTRSWCCSAKRPRACRKSRRPKCQRYGTSYSRGAHRSRRACGGFGSTSPRAGRIVICWCAWRRRCATLCGGSNNDPLRRRPGRSMRPVATLARPRCRRANGKLGPFSVLRPFRKPHRQAVATKVPPAPAHYGRLRRTPTPDRSSF